MSEQKHTEKTANIVDNTQKAYSSSVTVEQVYFDKAKEWYTAKYLEEYRNVCYLIVIFLTLVFSIYHGYKITSSSKTTVRIPFAIYFDDTTSYFAKIAPIVGQKHEGISLSLARYMLKKYVNLRENYSRDLLNASNWNVLLNKVSNLSSRKVYSDFIHLMNTQENPDSPILKYRFLKKCDVRVHDIIFTGTSRQKIPNSATIYFDQIVSNGKNIVQVNPLKAYIEFSISNITAPNTKQPAHRKNAISQPERIYFIVTKYTVE